MSDKSNPLGGIETAREEAYIRKHDHELIEEMRRRMHAKEDAAELKSATGIKDDALLLRLAELGFDRETLPVLNLIPLIQVAWADNEIQPDERDLLMEAAKAHGVLTGPARDMFDSLLQTPPKPAFYDGALSFIAAMLQALPADESKKVGESLADLAWRVADANGGLFGLIGRVEDEEKEVLQTIAKRLAEGNPAASKKILDRL